MKYTNLVTTGCSYTSYLWDTWADYLGQSFNTHQNLGFSGSGPRFSWIQIQNYLKFNANRDNLEDTVIVVQWSSLMRNDLYTFNSTGNYHWVGGGQVNNNDRYSQEYLDRYFNIVDKALDLVYFIESLILASEKYKFKLVMFYMLEPWIDSFVGEPTGGLGRNSVKRQINDFHSTKYPQVLKDMYSSEYWITPSLELYTAEIPDPNKDPNDHHPSLLQHQHYASLIKKHLGISSTVI